MGRFIASRLYLLFDPASPSEPGTKNYIDNAIAALRALIGTPGATTLNYAATVTPSIAGNVAHLRVSPSLTGPMTVNPPTGGSDTQRWVLEATASGGQQTITFASGYLLGGTVTSRTVTVPSGATALIYLVQLGSTPRLAGVDPGG